MIVGSQTWQQGLNTPQKQALYVLTIPQLGIVLSSFSPAQIVALSETGWGVALWGVAGWGT